jgi:vancomycin permeability regulator SanA
MEFTKLSNSESEQIGLFEKLKRWLRTTFTLMILATTLITCFVAVLPFWVYSSTYTVYDNSIYTDVYKTPQKEYALILGSGGQFFSDRLKAGYELYRTNTVKKLILSGSTTDGRVEAEIMKDYYINLGVDESDLILDKAGQDTYRSCTFLKEHNYKDVIIVTQSFHMIRSLYLCSDSDPIGFASDPGNSGLENSAKYAKQDIYSLVLRDFLALYKAWAEKNNLIE